MYGISPFLQRLFFSCNSWDVHPRTLVMISFQFETVGKLIQQVTTGIRALNPGQFERWGVTGLLQRNLLLAD